MRGDVFVFVFVFVGIGMMASPTPAGLGSSFSPIRHRNEAPRRGSGVPVWSGWDRSLRRAGALYLAALALGLAPATASDGPDDPGKQADAEGYMQLLGELKGLDWQEEGPRAQRAVDNLWRQNGWTDEADRFARDLAHDASAIPPWEFLSRLNLVSDRMAARYEFSPEQTVRIRAAALREVASVLATNAGLVVDLVREALQTRAEARPYTAEQIARWTRETEPLHAEVAKRADSFIEEVKRTLTAKQKRILERDLQSYRKRQAFLDRARERWARGEWKPSDWGMQDDPIQRGVVPPRGAPPGPQQAELSPETDPRQEAPVQRWLAHDPKTWLSYVLDFKRRYRLDPGQMTTARSIHDELLERAKAYFKSHAVRLEAVPPSERPAHGAYAPIRAMFAELKDRLKAIPTTVQQAQVKP